MAKKLIIKQVRSAIGRKVNQKRTLRALGIHRLHQTREVQDSPSVRGMIQTVVHLLEVKEE